MGPQLSLGPQSAYLAATLCLPAGLPPYEDVVQERRRASSKSTSSVEQAAFCGSRNASPAPSNSPFPAGKGGALIGPPYLGPLFSNFFNTTRLTPLNPQAHSSKSCRQGCVHVAPKPTLPLDATPLPRRCRRGHHQLCFHTRWGMCPCPLMCRRLYDETVHLLEGKTRTPLPHKLPGAYRGLPGTVDACTAHVCIIAGRLAAASSAFCSLLRTLAAALQPAWRPCSPGAKLSSWLALDISVPQLTPSRDHPWQESAAGRDRARPVDATLEPRQSPYWTHGMVARARQASRRSTPECADRGNLHSLQRCKLASLFSPSLDVCLPVCSRTMRPGTA